MRALALAAALLASAPVAAQTVTITNARLVLGDGSAPIANGTVVIRNGRVVSAGPRGGGAAAGGGQVVDAGGKWVTPGIFAGYTVMGLVEVDGVEETDDTSARQSPFDAGLDVAAAVNPRATPIAINRSAGVTRAVVSPAVRGSIFGGQGAVIDLGADMDAVTRPRAFQFMEYGQNGARGAGGSRPAALAMLRNALFEAQAYNRNPASYADRGTNALVTRLDAAALVPVVNGTEPLMVHVERGSDMLALIDLKREFSALRMVFVGATEAWTVAPQLAAARVPVIASALADLPADFERLASTQSNIGRLLKAGVTVGVGMINDEEARQARLEKQYAGNLVALQKVPGATGLTWDQAFAAITSGPAEALGVADELGSLRPGRRGDVVIWDGDPLELSTAATAVWIDGVAQPMVDRQQRLRDRYLTPTEGVLPKAYQH